jgi:sodium transport system permease protein
VLLWLRRLFREKERLPTTGQAFFCLGLLFGLRYLSLGFGNRWPLETRTAISELAFVAMPPLFMVLLLNTQPSGGLYLRWPSAREAGLAALLALLLLPPLAGLGQAVALWFPRLLEGDQALVKILRDIGDGRVLTAEQLATYFVAFALIPAICEEIAFRGFVLHGLHRHFRPRNAVLLSSFFFALFHMNVFLFLPTFILGMVLGLLTVRSRSLLPAILFHLLHNSVLIALIALCLVSTGALLWWLYRKPYVDLERREALERAARR